MPSPQAYTQQEIERIVDTYSDTLLRIAMHHTQNTGDAEDAVQTVFLKLLNAAPAFADTNHEKAWLIRVTINQCHDTVRSAWNRKTTGLEDGHAATGREEGFEILSVVKKLPEKYRDIIYLYYYEGYSTPEIAKMMKMPQATVESRLYRARGKLKSLLEGGWNDQ
ncbi:MAG: RNA polymerase sigma factor [Oscillospiraceae bacterium]